MIILFLIFFLSCFWNFIKVVFFLIIVSFSEFSFILLTDFWWYFEEFNIGIVYIWVYMINWEGLYIRSLCEWELRRFFLEFVVKEEGVLYDKCNLVMKFLLVGENNFKFLRIIFKFLIVYFVDFVLGKNGIIR